MRMLLVRPPITLQVAQRLTPFLHLEPLSLEIVAGGIPAAHWTRICDLAAEASPDKTFGRVLRKFQPDVVGFTGFSNQAAAVKRLAALAKAVRPETFVTVGGIHATIAPEDLRLPGTIDLVVRGEGGTAMEVLIPLLESKAPIPASAIFLPTDAPQFDALAAAPPPELPDFDKVPAARRDLVDRSRYYCVWHGGPGERLETLFPRTAAARTSVGCPYRCSFCVVHHLAHGKYIRQTSEAVVREIVGIPEDHVYFVDDEMFCDARRATAIAELLRKRGVRKHYISWARADTIVKHPEMFKLWKQIGLSLLYVGLESMEQENLTDYNKGLSADVNRRAVALLRELGIGLHAALMVNPDFTAEDFLKVREAVEKVAPAEVSFTVFSPPPGTDLWKKHRADFICPDPHAFYDCMHTLLPTRVPLKMFYRYLSLLWLVSSRHNPWRMNKVKAPLRDIARFMYHGMRYGWSVRNIYKDYRGHQLPKRSIL